MKLKDMIDSMVTKFAALALALVCAGNVWATTVATEAELRAAIANGGAVTLGGNIALTQGEIAVSNTVTLDLATYTISSPTNVFRIAANGNFTVNAAATNPGGISVPTNRCCVYTSYGWDPGAKTVVLNGGVFTGNCVFNWAASALSAYVSYENYGLAVDGAGSGEKAVPTSVTINGGTFTGGYELGNVGAYRCYYFTVNGGTFEKGLDCADTRYCSIGVTTTCKAYFNGGRYRDRYPTFRKKKQGLSVVDDPGKVFIGTTTHTNSYYIAGGYYVNAYDRSACEVTGTYAGAAVQSSYLIFLTTGYPQRWYNPSDTWYFLTEDDAEDVGATNVIHINGENGSLPQLQSSAASSSAIRLASGKGTLLAASKSAASPAVASARLQSAAPARLLTTASAPADVITTRPAGTELGEIKVVGNDGHTYITQNASLLSGTVFKTELDAERIDACYFFGPASSPYITENDGSDDETVYAAIRKRVSDAMEALISGSDELSFTAEERKLLLDNASSLAFTTDDGSGSTMTVIITEDCFSDTGDGSYGLTNDEADAMALVTCVIMHSALNASTSDPFESDPHLTWDLSLVVSFDKAVSADSVRFWWAAGGSNTVGDGHLKDSGTSVGALAANEVLSLSLGSGNKFDTFFLRGNGAPFPLLVAVQNLSNANRGTAVTVKLRVTNPSDSSQYADRASFTHVFGRDTIIAVDPVEGRFKEYNIVDGENVPWGELNRQYKNDKGIEMGIVYSSTRTALETAFNAIENVLETGLENVSIAAGEGETQQKWVQIEWHGIVSVRDGYPMTTIAFGIEPLLRSIVADENNEVTSDTTRAITNTELNNQTIKFRLPLTDDYTARALVVHTSDDANYPEERWIANVGGSAGARYVEISTKHFSEFTVSPLGADDIVYVTSAAGAFIGGYTTLADAYAATEDGGTIYLLQNVSENLKVSTAKTFNINANGSTYSGAVTAASGLVLSATTSGTTTTYAAAVAIAQIGTTKYETLQAAIAAASDGDTVELLADIELDKDVHVTTSGENIYSVLVDGVYKYQVAAPKLNSLTIDGAGHTISMGANPTFGRKYGLSGGSAFFFGKYGDNGEVEGTYTLKNITFEDFDREIIRVGFASLNIDNCTFDGNHITEKVIDCTTMIYAYQGALNVSGSTFTDNTVSGTYALIFSNNSKPAATVTIDNNLFKNNGTSAQPSGGNGLIYLSNAASVTDAITSNTFEANYVQNASGNAAVVYLSKPVETFSGNLFKDNHVNVPASGKKEGVIVLGSGAAGTPVTGNAFVGNVLDSELPTKRATIVVGGNTDISGNYWGDGQAPETGTGADIYLDGSPTITMTGYATAYTANTESNGTAVSVVDFVAQIGTTKYETLAAAIAAAQAGDTVQLLADIEFEDSLDIASDGAVITLDLGGKKLSAAEGKVANDKFTANSAHDYLIGVKYGTVLQIVDSVGGGAIDGSNLIVAVKLTTKGETPADDEDCAALVVGSEDEDWNDFTISGDYYGISGNGTRHQTSLEVFGGTIQSVNESEGSGIYQPQDGYLAISGGTIKGFDSAIEVRAGDANFWGGNYVVTGDSAYSVSGNGSGTTIKGAAIAVDPHTTGKTLSVSVLDGNSADGASFSFTVPDGAVCFGVANANNADFDNVSVTVVELDEIFGGSFDIVEGYNWYYDNSVEVYGLHRTVAETLDANGDHVGFYQTLEDALAAAQDGDTVQLLVNIAVGAQTGNTSAFKVAGKSITIDGNGKTITATGDGKGYVFWFCEDANKKLANCSLKNLTINSTGYQIDILVGGNDNYLNTLSVDNVSVTTEGEALYASDISEITATESSFAQNGKYKSGQAEPYYAAVTVGYAGVVTLTDCTVSAVDGSYAVAPFPSGGTINLNTTTVTGDLFAWVGNGPTATPADTVINVNSGKIAGNYGYRVSNNGNGHEAVINVNGGVFKNSPANVEGVVIKTGYEVVANADEATKDAYPWTVAHKSGYIVEDEDDEGYAVILAVDSDWIAANVTNKVGETATTAEIEAELNKSDEKTKLKKWEAYVLNQEEPIKIESVGDAGALTTTLVDAKTGTGLDVTYSLVSIDGESETDRTPSANKSFALETATDGSLETGLYKVRVHFKPTGDTSASEITVDSENTVGVLKTQPTGQFVVVPVPFKELGGDDAPVKVASYIRSGLADGDVLHVYNGSNYDSWTYNGTSSSWEKTTNMTVNDENTASTSESAEPSDATLSRGTAAILRRAPGNTAPLVFVGDYTGAAEEQTIAAGWNLVASPSLEAFEPATKFTSGKIQIPGDGLPKNYTFKNGKWGYSGVVDTPYGKMPGRIEVDTLPAGTGFWYFSDSQQQVEW